MTSALIVFLTKFLAAPGVRWIGCDPTPKQRIFFANHTSNLDTLIVWAALPKRVRKVTRPVAGQDYWLASSLRRHLAVSVFNAVLIERRKVTAENNPLHLLLEALQNGSSLILFPEGGRHEGPEPGAFKSGLYHVARKRRDIEMVPVFIDNANRILPKGEILPVPLLSSITFGAPIRLNDAESKPAFLDRARNAVSSLRNQ
jgi:1-acyl-sn-glycerol-3-phosphate acyltransferase